MPELKQTQSQKLWLILMGGQQVGPMTESVLIRRFNAGEFSAQTLASCGDGWITVDQIATGLLDLPEPPPVVPDQPVSVPATAPNFTFFNAQNHQNQMPDGSVTTEASGPPPLDALDEIDAETVGRSPPPIPSLSPPPLPVQDGIQSAENEFGPTSAVRDRIVILGRRRSGKTIYLAALYNRLWRGLNGMSARALSGDVHKRLIGDWETLRRGEWPPVTLETSLLEMEIIYHQRAHQVVMFDFAGENFRKAFVDNSLQDQQVQLLLDQLDRAAAVLMLVDPAAGIKEGSDAAMDDDFGLVQAANRLRSVPGGSEVPIALVLTKIDQFPNLARMTDAAYLRQQFNPLIRTLKQLAVFKVSAVQTEPGPDGRLRPRRDSVSREVENPLKHCLRVLHKQQDESAQRQNADAALIEQTLRERAERINQRRQNIAVTLTIGTILILGLAWMFYSARR